MTRCVTRHLKRWRALEASAWARDVGTTALSATSAMGATPAFGSIPTRFRHSPAPVAGEVVHAMAVWPSARPHAERPPERSLSHDPDAEVACRARLA